MRTIRYFLTYLVVFLIIFAVVFFVAQRVLLFVGQQQMISAVTSVKTAATQQVYFSKCREINQNYGELGSGTSFQLRFEDDRTYVIESVCTALPERPQEISRGELPLFVTKVPGTSGFLINSLVDITQVRLAAFSQVSAWVKANLLFLYPFVSPTVAITVAEEKVILSDQEVLPGTGPLATCSGYGYSCCDLITEQGVGEPIKVSDCKNRCYSACTTLPSIISFSAAPNYDQFMRKVTIAAGETLELWAVANVTENLHMTVNFGDGDAFQGTINQQPVTHQYRCVIGTCSYQATVQLRDADGRVSVISPVSTIAVDVQAGR